MPESYAAAALRHRRDAAALAETNRQDGAGYLIGYAAECAIKSHLESQNTEREKLRKNHLPKLIDQAKKLLQGRKSGPLLTILNIQDFMMGWKVELRYEEDGIVSKENYARWLAHANRAIGAANLRQQ